MLPRPIATRPDGRSSLSTPIRCKLACMKLGEVRRQPQAAGCPFSGPTVGSREAAPPVRRERWLTGSLREFRTDLLGFLGRLAREEGEVASFRLGRRRFVSV